MIHLGNDLWIGNAEEKIAEIHAAGIRSLLNVAQDLRGVCGWPDIEYMQVGLIDGPGNPPSAYYAAVGALSALLHRGSVMVFCHGGGRSTAVSVMYVAAKTGLD